MINFLNGLRLHPDVLSLAATLEHQDVGAVHLSPAEAAGLADLLESRSPGELPCSFGNIRARVTTGETVRAQTPSLGQSEHLVVNGGYIRLDVTLSRDVGLLAEGTWLELGLVHDRGGNIEVIARALRSPEEGTTGLCHVSAESDVLVFHAPTLKFRAQVPRAGLHDDSLEWLAQAGLDLRARQWSLSRPRDGVTVVQVELGERALSFANVDLAAPLVLTVSDLEALFTGRHDHSALRGFLSQRQETALA